MGATTTRLRGIVPRSPSALVLVVGFVLVAVHASGRGGLATDWVLIFVAVLALAAIVTGIRSYRPEPQWPWWCVAVSLCLFLIGGAVRQAAGSLGDLTSQRSLLPDVITIPGYVLLGVALWGLGRARRRGRPGDFDTMLDAAIAALAVFALTWTFLLSPVVERGDRAPVAVLILTGYPALSAFLVAFSARIAFSPGSRGVVAYRLLFIVMGMMLIGDLVYMGLEVDAIDLPLYIVDAPYAFAYVLCAACVLHPSMRRIGEQMPPNEVAPRAGRLLFITAALGVPAVITVASDPSGAADRIVLAAIVMALTITACWRVLRALRAHARSEAELSYQATHDPLTKLPNRLAAESHLEHMGNDVVGRGHRVALLFLDLDRFKLLNDTMGHSAGDELLVRVSERLRLVSPDDAMVARVGGDEFLIMLPDVTNIDSALDVCERIRSALEAPFSVRGHDTYTSASMGVTFTTERELAVNTEALIREADTAMYEAKDAGRNAVSVFDLRMREQVTERLTIEHDLHLALSRNEFDVHFQPIMKLPAGPVEGVEALLRWNHPERGAISPATFIPIAEETTLIIEIGTWVLERACRQISSLRRQAEVPSDLYVSVNLSARQLHDSRIVSIVTRALRTTGLSPDALCLELTESMLIEERSAFATLEALQRLGVRISIDDFGTGYSSLAYLQHLPAQTVKIDQSFVAALSQDDTSHESLVAAIIAMGTALGMKTVAEGVENETQEARLMQLGCQAAQGYFYARPVPERELAETIRRLSIASTTSA